MMCHLTIKTNQEYVFVNGTKFQSIKSNFPNFKV